MCKYTKYVESLGFAKVKKADKTTTPTQLKAFSYKALDAATIRSTLGKSRQHNDGKFAFVLAKDRGVFVSTGTTRVVLCNGVTAVKRMLAAL